MPFPSYPATVSAAPRMAADCPQALCACARTSTPACATSRASVGLSGPAQFSSPLAADRGAPYRIATAGGRTPDARAHAEHIAPHGEAAYRRIDSRYYWAARMGGLCGVTTGPTALDLWGAARVGAHRVQCPCTTTPSRHHTTASPTPTNNSHYPTRVRDGGTGLSTGGCAAGAPMVSPSRRRRSASTRLAPTPQSRALLLISRRGRANAHTPPRSVPALPALPARTAAAPCRRTRR